MKKTDPYYSQFLACISEQLVADEFRAAGVGGDLVYVRNLREGITQSIQFNIEMERDREIVICTYIGIELNSSILLDLVEIIDPLSPIEKRARAMIGKSEKISSFQVLIARLEAMAAATNPDWKNDTFSLSRDKFEESCSAWLDIYRKVAAPFLLRLNTIDSLGEFLLSPVEDWQQYTHFLKCDDRYYKTGLMFLQSGEIARAKQSLAWANSEFAQCVNQVDISPIYLEKSGKRLKNLEVEIIRRETLSR